MSEAQKYGDTYIDTIPPMIFVFEIISDPVDRCKKTKDEHRRFFDGDVLVPVLVEIVDEDSPRARDRLGQGRGDA